MEAEEHLTSTDGLSKESISCSQDKAHFKELVNSLSDSELSLATSSSCLSVIQNSIKTVTAFRIPGILN